MRSVYIRATKEGISIVFSGRWHLRWPYVPGSRGSLHELNVLGIWNISTLKKMLAGVPMLREHVYAADLDSFDYCMRHGKFSNYEMFGRRQPVSRMGKLTGRLHTETVLIKR